MGKTEPTVSEVLRSARQMLDFARVGAKDFEESGDRKLSGLYNAVTNGRSVTFVLQKLKGRAHGFEAWYAEVQASLKEDTIARWFVELRNRIEKEGTHGNSSTMTYIAHLNSEDLRRQAPPNAKSIFVGDQHGRSGWTVALEDGSEADVYFRLPPSAGWSTMIIEDSPGGMPTEDLLPLWLDRLDKIVCDADARFGGASR